MATRFGKSAALGGGGFGAGLGRAALVALAVIAAAACAVDAQAQGRSGRSGRKPRDVSLFRKQYVERREKFAAALEELARSCDEKGLEAAAEEVRNEARARQTVELRITSLPREVQPALPADLPADERPWRAQLKFQKSDYAKDLYLLSRQALNSGHVGFALDLIREVALCDPDHVAARKVLGFVRNGNEWLSAFESAMKRDKKVWHDEFGWIPRDHVSRYEQGERLFKGRWISAAKEAELRRDFGNAWEISTEHFLVKTNHSRERGVELARKLEDFYRLFHQVMAGFFSSSDQVQQLLAGGSGRAPAPRKPHVVHYYRTADEYFAVLRKLTNQPVEITKGIYFPRSGIAYFFYDPESDDDSTLYHEATHQLLSGSRPKIGEIGVKSDFWAIEGIACYMESFDRRDGRSSVGDPGHGRLQAARAHFLNESYYVPFLDFTHMGMVAFQGAREISKNYSQGAALTHFFMHYEDGRYREAFIEYLSQIYSLNRSVRESPESLVDLTGVEPEELDMQYAEYIRDLQPQPAEPAALLGVGTEAVDERGAE